MYKRDVVMFDLVSLTVGISALPFGNSLAGDIQPFGELFLGKAALFSQRLDSVSNCHDKALLCLVRLEYTKKGGCAATICPVHSVNRRLRESKYLKSEVTRSSTSLFSH